MKKLGVSDLDVKGRRVFVRVDFNVPLENGVVTDDTRIRETLPTLRLLLERGASLVVASHLGRPKGKPKPEFSLEPVRERLSSLLGRSVKFVGEIVGPAVDEAVGKLRPGRRSAPGESSFLSRRRSERSRVREESSRRPRSSTSTMPSAPPIGLTPRRKAW